MNSYDYIYGLHSVLSLLRKQPKQVLKLYLVSKQRQAMQQTILHLAEQAMIPIVFCSDSELLKRSGTKKHQGMMARCKPFVFLEEQALWNGLLDSLEKPNTLLILDGIQDPRNLGACIRNASAFGVQIIMLPKHHSASMTPVVRKVACGTELSISVVRVTNLARSITLLKERGIWIVGADAQASVKIKNIDFTGNTALILGGEGGGISALSKRHCDFLMSIPMQNDVESLNVSVACGITLYELRSQRQASW